jgi:AcrR family transcriptional regulator
MAVSKRDQNRIEQRARILASARDLFGTRGFEEVTMTDVARAAGVARATVFNYFASKRALIDPITEDVLDEYAAMLDLALANDATPVPTLLRALVEQMGQGIEEVEQFYKGVFREIAKMQAGLDEGGSAARARRLTVGRVEGLMACGQAKGEISADHDARDLAYAFDALTHGTILHWLYDDPSKSLSERMGRAIEIFLGGIARGPSATRGGEVLPSLREPNLSQSS